MLNSKQKRLNELEAAVNNCNKCELCKTRTNVVFASGNPKTAKAVLIGEAPGANEDLQGKPFVGKAGIYLDRMLQEAGIDRENDLYIINTIKCRPIKFNEKNGRSSNRPPSKNEKESCNYYLMKQVEILEPDLLILCGNNALKSFLGSNASITKYRGSFFEVNKIKSTAIFHPSYLMQYAKDGQREQTVNDLKTIKSIF